MPELPEVETVVRDIEPLLVGRRVLNVRRSGRTLRLPWDPAWSARLAGQRVTKVFRRGKWIVLTLEGDLHLVLHLGMTGQLRVVPKEEPLAPHTHLVLELDRGKLQLRFRDVRRFGSATLRQGPVEKHFAASQLGPEPFGLDSRYWRSRLTGTARIIKAVLLDQRVVAGVGNIYADEALFEARIHPARMGKQLTGMEVSRLRKAVGVVLRRAIRRRGSSIRDYVGGNGTKGKYQIEFRVYGRQGAPCTRCRTPIERIRLAGRSTHYCPHCQPC